jgi:hypothetical protein
MTASERELEAALAGLAPARSAIDRDRVMFCAGRASVRRRTRLWQGLSSALVVLLLALALTRPFVDESKGGSETVARPVARTPYRAIEPVDQGQIEAFRQYVRTRRAVLNRGVEAIEASSGVEGDRIAPPLTRKDLDDLLS